MERSASVKKFEDLWIWQEARKLVSDVYRDFSESKGSKDFGFRDQIQRAGVSIMNNISEGFERTTDADFARFLDIAKGSCGELRNMYYAAEDLDYVSIDVANERRGRARKISAGIVGLTKHLRSDS
jgi:four helix bundle protein